MSTVLLAVIIGIPLVLHLGVTALVYVDAGNVGMEPRKKWVAITAAIPIFGFFIYIFERSERDYDPDEDPYRGHNFNIHPSRADDAPLRSRGDDRLEPDEQARDHDQAWPTEEGDWDDPDSLETETDDDRGD